MNRLKRKGYVVEADLKRYGYKEYFVECTYRYDKEKEKYLLRMGLKPKNSDSRVKIEFNEIDTQYVPGTKENIEDHIDRIIEQAATSKFFDSYVEQFEYECKCFDIGNEILEKERINNENEKQGL